MSDLNPNNRAFNFELRPWTEPVYKEGTASRTPCFEIGEVVLVYPDAARANIADEDPEDYRPDEKLIGLITKIAWCPKGLDEDKSASDITETDRTYVYFMKRIDAPQDSKTKMLVAIEEDLEEWDQPAYKIGQFVQLPALGYHESERNPELRMCRVVHIWWYHEKKHFHYQVRGASDPADDRFGSGVEPKMFTIDDIEVHKQPRFNNRQEVQLRIVDSPSDMDPLNEEKYQIANVCWDMTKGQFRYQIVKFEGLSRADIELFVGEDRLMPAQERADSDEFEASTNQDWTDLEELD